MTHPDSITATTRYEQIMLDHSHHPADAAARLREASRTARNTVAVSGDQQRQIRDVAAGVAAPTLIGAVIWMLEHARHRRLSRLRFLSRDGQIFYELARRLPPHLHAGIDLEYVYSSRLTWSLAASNADSLDQEAWLFNSFMKSNATDLCARLGLRINDHLAALEAAGVSLDADTRADEHQQIEAMKKFLRTPRVRAAVGARITETRQLLIDYAAAHRLDAPDTGLVDAGWTGRMIDSLIRVCSTPGRPRPHALLWGYEPRDPDPAVTDHVSAYMYNTATRQGADLRVPDAPYLVETFCMGDHGIVTGYHRSPTGTIQPILKSVGNPAPESWGLRTYRDTLYAVADSFTHLPDQDLRPLIHDLMAAFWCNPTPEEAATWGSYPYDSDPAGTAVRPLATPLEGPQPRRGDRAWIAGTLAISNPDLRQQYLTHASATEVNGTPATD
ncbi:hypothetical protein [Nocardia noduli]|uniref:hypothetical protein n=1 Tax=Nocardia noduli TaxID=2815722 RepID=UPI001C22F24B|nr:hypothetical protein [Nocardia noduli]